MRIRLGPDFIISRYLSVALVTTSGGLSILSFIISHQAATSICIYVTALHYFSLTPTSHRPSDVCGRTYLYKYRRLCRPEGGHYIHIFYNYIHIFPIAFNHSHIIYTYTLIIQYTIYIHASVKHIRSRAV